MQIDSKRIKTNFLHNTPFYLQLGLQHVSARFIGHLQEVIDSGLKLELSNVVTIVVVFTIIKIIKIEWTLWRWQINLAGTCCKSNYK